MATGNTLLLLMPLGYEPPASNMATLDTRNNHPVLDFDASTDESAIWTAIMPQNYSGGGITVYIHYAMTSATSGNIIWQSAIERIGEATQDIDSDGFASANSSATTAVPGTSGHIDILTIAHASGAEMDSVAAGEAFRIKINRDADNVSDTATGDAEILSVEIRET